MAPMLRRAVGGGAGPARPWVVAARAVHRADNGAGPPDGLATAGATGSEVEAGITAGTGGDWKAGQTGIPTGIIGPGTGTMTLLSAGNMRSFSRSSLPRSHRLRLSRETRPPPRPFRSMSASRRTPRSGLREPRPHRRARGELSFRLHSIRMRPLLTRFVPAGTMR